MSVGQGIGGAVGAVAGFFLGGGPVGALKGFSLGYSLGGMIDPPKGPDTKGPRLDDLSLQTSTYGSVIPRCYGTTAVFGNIFWLENNKLREIAKKKKSGGKGGSKSTVTTYSYWATFALGLCEGPIVAIRRIWIGGKIVYDGGATDQGTIRASNGFFGYFVLYKGTDTQTADPRMQSTLGATNVPGYRGLAYLVFYDLPLADFGNSLMGAQIKVEVVGNGSVASYVADQNLMPTPVNGDEIYTDIAWNGREFVATRNCGTSSYTDVMFHSYDGITWTKHNLPYAPNTNGTVVVEASPSLWLAAHNYWPNYLWSSKDGKNWTASSCSGNPGYCDIKYNGEWWMVFPRETNGQCAISRDGKSWVYPTSQIAPHGNFSGKCLGTSPKTFIAVKQSLASTAFVFDITTQTWKTTTVTGRTSGAYVCNYSSSLGCFILLGGTEVSFSYDEGDTWTTYTVTGVAGNPGFVFHTGDVWVTYGKYSVDGINWTAFSLVNTGALNIYGGCWNGAVITLVGSDSFNFSDVFTISPTTLTQAQPTLANILTAELLKSNLLTAGDIDVTQLTANVRGYTVALVAALRSAIEPLQAAWPFDVIQSGYKIKFVKRGGSSIATIPAGALDARASGDSPGVSITNIREMDIVLPYRVRLLFSDYDREYDTGEQYAERLNTDSINIRSIELAIVLTAGEAAGMAEVLLYLAWLERYDITLTLPPTYNQVEPADIITVNADEGTYSLRITQATYTQDGRVECQAKYHSAATYTPTAVGVAGAVTGSVLLETGPTVYAVLDIPTIIDTTDTPGVVVAMAGYSAGWNGGTLYRSDDAGQIWTDLQGTSAPGSNIGNTVGALASGRTDIIDTANTLTVTMIEGTLSSVSELSMVNGANWFAIGDHDRWEIVAVKTCTLVSGSTYTLSDFLRGRYGTEWAMSLHQDGDWIVQLDGDTAAFVNYPLSAIGASHYYRGITNGQSFDSAGDLIQSYTGVALECLSPVYGKASKSVAYGDWAISWTRRTRIGGEWRDFVDVPLSEASEAYIVEFYNGVTLVSSHACTTSSLTYTEAQQIADFGADQVSLTLKIYQVSANVGKGYPLSLSATSSFTTTRSLGLHLDGSNGSTTFTDVTGKTVSAIGSPSISTAQYATALAGNTASLFLNAASALSIPTSTDFDFANRDNSFDCWVRLSSIGASQLIFTKRQNNVGVSPLTMYVDATGHVVVVGSMDGTSYALSMTTGVTLTTAVWYHLAFTRIGTAWTIYIDGVSRATATLSGIIFSNAHPLIIGGDSNANYFDGYIDDVDMQIGTSKYPGAFTRPSVPFT